MMQTDTQLQKDVMAELKWDSIIDAAKIDVKALAVDIEVVLQGSNNRSHAVIALTAENILEWTTIWLKDQAKVMVGSDWVSFSTELYYKYQRQLSTASLPHLMGIIGVSNQITVKPSLSSLIMKC